MTRERPNKIRRPVDLAGDEDMADDVQHENVESACVVERDRRYHYHDQRARDHHRHQPGNYKMFGYTEGEMITQNVSMLMSALYHGDHDHDLARCRETDEKKSSRSADAIIVTAYMTHRILFANLVQNEPWGNCPCAIKLG